MEKTCKCGHNINDPEIVHETVYSKWGWFLLTILGLSAKPRLVKFYCRDCKEEIVIANDQKTLSKFVGR